MKKIAYTLACTFALIAAGHAHAETGYAAPYYQAGETAKVSAPSDTASLYWGENALLGTRPGIDAALQVSNYHYREPSGDLSLSGEKGGGNALATMKFMGDNFATLDFRFAFGPSDYSAAGKAGGKPEQLFDARGLVGHDFAYKWYGISPYIGLGFRHLVSDDRGLATDGSEGYRRDNSMYYIPIGFTQRFRVTPTDRVSFKLEYDHMFYGRQKSRLSDSNSILPDLENVQHHGTGYRAELMWDTRYFSVGPFASYWVIANSESNTACAGICLTGQSEAHNNTLEVGAQIKFHPFDF